MEEKEVDDAIRPEDLELILVISLAMTVSCFMIIFAFPQIEAFNRNLYLVLLVFMAASILGGWTILGSGEVAKLFFKE